MNSRMIINRPCLLPDRFQSRARHFRLPKSAEPILFSQVGARSTGEQAGRQAVTEKESRSVERKPGRKREKTNKFAANRPLKTRHANGSRGNFKFYDSESRRCDIRRLFRLPRRLLPPHELPLRLPSPVSPSPLHLPPPSTNLRSPILVR